MPDKYERFVASYLRLNGYFTVPNFIVHAPDRTVNEFVGNYTETDIIGIRMPHSKEIAGELIIVNHSPLIDNIDGKIDVVIAEAKSGNKNTPNTVWIGPKKEEIANYIIRFIGIHKEDEILTIGQVLSTSFQYEDDRCRIRYIICANEENPHYQKMGVTYITFDNMIEFIVDIRGKCWIKKDLGIASIHHQWDDLLIDLFSIANKHDKTSQERIAEIKLLLSK